MVLFLQKTLTTTCIILLEVPRVDFATDNPRISTNLDFHLCSTT